MRNISNAGRENMRYSTQGIYNFMSHSICTSNEQLNEIHIPFLPSQSSLSQLTLIKGTHLQFLAHKPVGMDSRPNHLLSSCTGEIQTGATETSQARIP